MEARPKPVLIASPVPYTSSACSGHEILESYRHAFSAPGVRLGVDHAGTPCSAARATASVLRQIPFGEYVPVSADECRAARGAVGAFPGFVIHVAGVRITDSVFYGDCPSPGQGARRRGSLSNIFQPGHFLA